MTTGSDSTLKEKVKECAMFLNKTLAEQDVLEQVAVNALFHLFIVYSRAQEPDYYTVRNRVYGALEHYKKTLWKADGDQ